MDLSAREYYELGSCRAGQDGECSYKDCPQLKDNEPHKSGRHCPLDRVLTDTHKKRNYEICTAIDLTKLGIVIDNLVQDGENKQYLNSINKMGYELNKLLRFINDQTNKGI